jgi:hypothetical protein
MAKAVKKHTRSRSKSNRVGTGAEFVALAKATRAPQFDATEYLDVMIATEHEPFAMRETDGSLPSVHMSEARRRTVFALWKIANDAPRSTRLIIAECIRRALVR